jgi:hypothetical protein
LSSIDAELYWKGDGYAVVKLHQDHLPVLRSKELQWRVLSDDVPVSLYYIVPERGCPPVETLDVLVLDRNPEGNLVSAGPEAATKAREQGFKAIPLDKPWPINPEGFWDLEFVHDSVVRDLDYKWILSTVSQDTLASFIKHLEDYGTRFSYSPQVQKAGEWLIKRLWNFGYTDTLFQGVLLDDGKVTIAPSNVMATKPGATRPDVHILLGGHYDSISDAVQVGRAPGADDNASGTAATLEIARVLADVELDASVQFVLFTGEEQGLLGSNEFVSNLREAEVPLDKLFFINMDMIGNSASFPWTVRLFYDERSQPLAGLAARIGEAYTEMTSRLSGMTGASDHIPFWRAGYTALFFHERDFSDHYHSAHDLLEHLEMDYEAEVVKTVLATVLHLANIADPPDEVTAVETESGDLRVEWSRSSDADVLGYHVELLNRDGELIDKVSTKETYALLSQETFQDGVIVRVKAEDVLGESEASEPLLVDTSRLLAAGATPNPTSGPCRFSIFVPGSGPSVKVSIRIVDGAGRLVRSLNSPTVSRGALVMKWDGAFTDGSPAPPGVYFYNVEADGVAQESGRIMVVR